MPPALTIRPATPDDLPAVRAIVHAAYAPYIPRIGREPGPMLEDYAALIGAGQVRVAVREGAVRGLLVLLPDPQPETLLLDNVAVDPAAQGLGLGRALLDFAEDTARQAGCRAIRLYTNEAMVENLRLYARRGYVETHRAEEKGLRRVFLRKALG